MHGFAWQGQHFHFGSAWITHGLPWQGQRIQLGSAWIRLAVAWQEQRIQLGSGWIRLAVAWQGHERSMVHRIGRLDVYEAHLVPLSMQSCRSQASK